MTSLNLNEPRQIGEVAIHAVEAFHGDQDALVAVARRGEEFVQFVEIVVREQAPLGARQRPANDDAVMSKRIMDDEVLRSEQRADG